MKTPIFKNWRTTLTGAFIAAGYAALTLMQKGSMQPKEILIACGIAALGAISKDANVTGI
jgi:hypothetical protein